MSRKIKTFLRYQIVFMILGVMIVLGIIMNVNAGTVSIPPMRIFRIIFANAEAGSMDSNIIWKLRLPRLLTVPVLTFIMIPQTIITPRIINTI